MKTKIVAMTTMCGDIFDATGEIRPGGEALNFAAIASEYPHVEISLVGAIGDDECGRETVITRRILGTAVCTIPSVLQIRTEKS